MKKWKLFLFITLAGCSSQPRDCRILAKEILDKYSGKVHPVYDSSNILVGISDNDISSVKGGVYYITRQGQLESYKFFKTKLAYSYNEEYDSTGQMIKQNGKGIVDENIREV